MSDSQEDRFSGFFEVMVPDTDGSEWIYWVETEDLDVAVAAAVRKHVALGRPEVLDDEDGGTFPMAYKPVIEGNRGDALIIPANQLST
jgi:hypothetical protein